MNSNMHPLIADVETGDDHLVSFGKIMTRAGNEAMARHGYELPLRTVFAGRLDTCIADVAAIAKVAKERGMIAPDLAAQPDLDMAIAQRVAALTLALLKTH